MALSDLNKLAQGIEVKPYSDTLGGESFTWALKYLLTPDSPSDERNALVMIDNLVATQRITNSQLLRLAKLLRTRAIQHLASIREDEFSRAIPPERERFWWYQPWERES